MIIQLIAFSLAFLCVVSFIILYRGINYTKKIKTKVWVKDLNGKETKIKDENLARMFHLLPDETEIERGYYKTTVTKERRRIDNSDFFPLHCGATVALLILSLAFVGIDIYVRYPIVVQKQYTEYQLKEDDLKLQQTTLRDTLTGKYVIDTDGTYHIIVDIPNDVRASINSYNKSVLDFKSELYMRHIKARDPLTSWFYCTGYTLIEGFNPSATNYKTIINDLTEFKF